MGRYKICDAIERWVDNLIEWMHDYSLWAVVDELNAFLEELKRKKYDLFVAHANTHGRSEYVEDDGRVRFFYSYPDHFSATKNGQEMVLVLSVREEIRARDEITQEFGEPLSVSTWDEGMALQISDYMLKEVIEVLASDVRYVLLEMWEEDEAFSPHEFAKLNDEQALLTLVAVNLLKAGRRHFEILMGSILDELIQAMDEFIKKEYPRLSGIVLQDPRSFFKSL